MKKIQALLLAIVCIFTPFMALGEYTEPDSPLKIWYATPELDFELVNGDEFYEYLSLILNYYDLDSFAEMVLDTSDYELVDMIVVNLDQFYTKVTWYTPYIFTDTDICVFMISADLLQGYVMNGFSNRHGELIVNYSGLYPGKYFMIIYTA